MMAHLALHNPREPRGPGWRSENASAVRGGASAIVLAVTAEATESRRWRMAWGWSSMEMQIGGWFDDKVPGHLQAALRVRFQLSNVEALKSSVTAACILLSAKQICCYAYCMLAWRRGFQLFNVQALKLSVVAA